MVALGRAVFAALLSFGVWYWTQCDSCCDRVCRFQSAPEVFGPGYVVLITGTSSGVGAETARQYASRGVKLVLIARRAAELEAVANQCWALGAHDVLAISADMSKQEDIETVIGSALKSFGRLDVVIINHAAFQEKLLMEHSSPSELVSELTRIHSANVVGPTLLSLAALSALERTSGRLVFISSGSAIATPPFHVIYAASKAASNTIFAGLKTELDQLGRTNVSITVAVLGLIGTDENMNRGDALASRSMPVPDCAAGIICAVDSRTAVAYVPKTLSMFSTLIHHMPFLAPSLIKSNYIDLVPSFQSRFDALRKASPKN